MNMQDSGKVALLVVTELMARSRLEAAARAASMRPVVTAHLVPTSEVPDLVVVDLDRAGVMDEVRAWREVLPSVPVVGFVSHVDGEVRKEAESLGLRVVPRGATTGDASRIFSQA